MSIRSQCATVLIVGALLVSGCGMATADDIVGNWSASDGTGAKIVTANGACQSMYYNGGKPLDIGGGMTCSFSKNKDSAGFHSLIVSQPPNQSTLKLKFINSDSVEVHDGSGRTLFTMTRS